MGLDRLDYFFMGSISTLGLAWTVKRITFDIREKKQEKALGTSSNSLKRGGPPF